MSRSRFALNHLALMGLILSLGLACADSGAPAASGVGLAVVDFAYVDTSGEPADQTLAHRKRLQALMIALRRDLSADGHFHLVSVSCWQAPCTDGQPTPTELLRATSEAGAKILVIGGIHKESTLVEWAKVQAIDTSANRVVFDRLFTFRGDSNEAWDRAGAFVSEEIRAALASALTHKKE